MHKYLVFVALLGAINHVVQSTPQSFSQSFFSSSVLKPSGVVVVSSSYTDSEGKSVVNALDPELGSVSSFPALYSFLIPPTNPNGLPYVIETDEQQTPPPVPMPAYLRTSTVATTSASTAAPTAAPTLQAIKRTNVPTTRTPSTNRPTSSPLTLSSTNRPITAVVIKTSGIANRQQPTGSTGKKNDGSYIHDNSGQYKPDLRGQYRGN